MAALVDRIVVIDDVAFVDIVAEEVGHGLHGGDQRSEVDGDILALQDHFRIVVEQRVAVVVGQLKTLERPVFQCHCHFTLRGLERAAHHGQRDRVYLPGGGKWLAHHVPFVWSPPSGWLQEQR